ncbi:MAG: plastocyanin/azurin family copper-binding protein [Acidobacteriota bacterium]
MRKAFLLPILAVLLLAPAAARAATIQVTVRNFEFSPAVVNIQPGDTVVWTNTGGTHNVASDDGTSFSNELKAAPWTFSHKFNANGSFPYHCEMHPTVMQGTVNVGATLPTVPGNLQARGTSTSEVTLTWSNSTGETGYSIEMKSLGGAYQQVATAPQDATSAVIGSLGSTIGYVFRIRAENAAGFSAYSNEAQAAPDAPIASCVPDATTLCVNNGRFRVRTHWRSSTQSGDATAVALDFAPDSGLFYFFSSTNIEMLVKVLNACVPALGNKYWVFYAATTNVELTVTVTDSQTGKTKVYFNPLNTAALPVQDTNAFATCP